MARGRPSKYKPEYCEQLIEHCKQGLSFEAFAGSIPVHKDTIYEWAKKYPEFDEAKRTGAALSLLFWEKLGVAGAVGKVPGFNPTTWIFNMKNRFGWRDRQELEVSEIEPPAKNETPVLELIKKARGE